MIQGAEIRICHAVLLVRITGWSMLTDGKEYTPQLHIQKASWNWKLIEWTKTACS